MMPADTATYIAADRILRQLACFHHLSEGQHRLPKAAGDGGGTGPSIPWGALSQSMVMFQGPLLPVHHRAQSTADEPAGSRRSSRSASAWRCQQDRSRFGLGSMEYSAVTPPPPSGTWRGRRSSTLARCTGHGCFPHRIRQEPSFKLVDMGDDLHSSELIVFFFPSIRGIVLPLSCSLSGPLRAPSVLCPVFTECLPMLKKK